MTSPPPHPLARVQRAIRWQPRGACVTHLLIRFPNGDAARRLIRHLRSSRFREMFCDGDKPPAGTHDVVSLGFTYQGLRALRMPAGYLAALARHGRAFAQGAADRAAECLGDTGPSDATQWDRPFARHGTHALLTLHGPSDQGARDIESKLRQENLDIDVVAGEDLRGPQGQAGTWVHFGYRDGLTSVPIKGFGNRRSEDEIEHEPGEVLLGHANDHGSNRWLLPQFPRALRDFFRDGSFGVLRVIEQDVDAFDLAVANWASDLRMEATSDPLPELAQCEAYIRAKLCGRWPDGRLFDATGKQAAPTIAPTFDHGADPHGLACPYASHIRRMNPRPGRDATSAQGVAHARTRALLRRGTPYGQHGAASRGLLGWFFCADIEAQFEHLLGQWGDRDPLGAPYDSACKDPLIGQHEGGSVFTIPRSEQGPLVLRDFSAFCRTRGTLYAFYPSSHALDRMCQDDGYDLFERNGSAEHAHDEP